MEHNPYLSPNTVGSIDERPVSPPIESSPRIKRMGVAIRTMMFVSFCVVAFLAARKLYVFSHEGLLSTTIARAYQLPPLFAVAGSLFWFVQFGDRRRKLRSQIARTGFAGCIAGLLATLALATEIAERVRWQYPEYWSWTRDIDDFAVICFRELIVCFAVGATVATTCCLLSRMKKRSGLNNAVQ